MNKFKYQVSTNTAKGWGFIGVKLFRLTFVEFCRGGHSVYAVLNDGKKNYPMFLADFEKLVKSGTAGVYEANWEVCQRGTQYGLRAAKEEL